MRLGAPRKTKWDADLPDLPDQGDQENQRPIFIGGTWQ